jgi:hypothetical protein
VGLAEDFDFLRETPKRLRTLAHRRKYHFHWDEVPVLEADYIGAWGAFEPGQFAIVDFEKGLAASCSTYEMLEVGDGFRVIYEYSPLDGSEPVRVRDTVHLERRPCHFGGTRAYFIAPCCKRRVLRLAALFDGLRCGACGKITYSTQREGRTARLVRKAQILALRLGCEAWFLPPKKRPRYMHQRTFNKLNADRERVAAQINTLIGSRLARKSAALLSTMARVQQATSNRSL